MASSFSSRSCLPAMVSACAVSVFTADSTASYTSSS